MNASLLVPGNGVGVIWDWVVMSGCGELFEVVDPTGSRVVPSGWIVFGCVAGSVETGPKVVVI